MKVKKILKEKGDIIYSVNVEATIGDAMAEMNANKVGCLIVIDEAGDIKGIISERDILYKCFYNNESVADKFVKDLMTPEDKLIVAVEEDRVQYLMNIMTKNRIRHIPIVKDKKCIGIVSIGDVIKAFMENVKYEKKLLSDYIQGKYT